MSLHAIVGYDTYEHADGSLSVSGFETPTGADEALAEILAAGWGAYVSDDGTIMIETFQVYVDESFVGYAPTEAAAQKMAQAACFAAHEGDRTMWFDVRIAPRRGEDEDDIEYDIAVPPSEPPCPGREAHEWVPGDGGGVCGTDECSHCGTRHHWTTWGTHPDTGAQGYRVSRYEGGER